MLCVNRCGLSQYQYTTIECEIRSAEISKGKKRKKKEEGEQQEFQPRKKKKEKEKNKVSRVADTRRTNVGKTPGQLLYASESMYISSKRGRPWMPPSSTYLWAPSTRGYAGWGWREASKAEAGIRRAQSPPQYVLDMLYTKGFSYVQHGVHTFDPLPCV